MNTDLIVKGYTHIFNRYYYIKMQWLVSIPCLHVSLTSYNCIELNKQGQSYSKRIKRSLGVFAAIDIDLFKQTSSEKVLVHHISNEYT